jgi:hypothetical protein
MRNTTAPFMDERHRGEWMNFPIWQRNGKSAIVSVL